MTKLPCIAKFFRIYEVANRDDMIKMLTKLNLIYCLTILTSGYSDYNCLNDKNGLKWI